MATSPSPVPAVDPFDDFESVPALSFATAPVGTVVKGTISKLPKEVQDRDFVTKEPKFWKSGDPQMVVVLHVDLPTADGGLETRSVWAKKPSSLYRALGQAQKEAGVKFAIGGTLFIRFERTEPVKAPGMSPQKIYGAKYEPPVETDPWTSPSPAASRPSHGAAPASPKPTW